MSQRAVPPRAPSPTSAHEERDGAGCVGANAPAPEERFLESVCRPATAAAPMVALTAAAAGGQSVAPHICTSSRDSDR